MWSNLTPTSEAFELSNSNIFWFGFWPLRRTGCRDPTFMSCTHHMDGAKPRLLSFLWLDLPLQWLLALLLDLWQMLGVANFVRFCTAYCMHWLVWPSTWMFTESWWLVDSLVGQQRLCYSARLNAGWSASTSDVVSQTIYFDICLDSCSSSLACQLSQAYLTCELSMLSCLKQKQTIPALWHMGVSQKICEGS